MGRTDRDDADDVADIDAWGNLQLDDSIQKSESLKICGLRLAVRRKFARSFSDHQLTNVNLVGKMSGKNRKQNFIDTHVQGSLVRRILMHWCIFFVVTCMLVAVLNALSGDPSLPFAEKVVGETGTLAMVAVSMLVLFPAFALDTIRFSNRFVGPISRLRRSLRELGQNKTTQRIQFRDNDFWAQMADEFNEVVELVESREAASQQEETTAV